jgi:hypothetical protein
MQAAPAQTSVAATTDAGKTALIEVALLIAGALVASGLFHHAVFRAVAARRAAVAGNFDRDEVGVARPVLRPSRSGPAGRYDPRYLEEDLRKVLRAGQRQAA